MGIQGLWAFLEKKHGDVFGDVCVASFKGKRFVIDVSIYMHRFGHETPWDPPIAKFLEQAAELQSHGAEPVYIFDGKRDPAKRHEHKRRQEQAAKLESDSVKRAEFVTAIDGGALDTVDTATAPADVRRVLEPTSQKLNLAGFGEVEVELDIKAEVARIRERHEKEKERGGARVSFPDSHYHALMTALDEAGIGYYIAGGDAEQLGAQLTLTGEADILVTDDGDALAFGAKAMLRNLFQLGKKGMQMLSSEAVADALALTKAQFADVCIISGCDFTESRGIPSIGPDRAVKLIKKHGGIDAYLASSEWAPKLDAIRKKYPEFEPSKFEHKVAQAVFSNNEPEIVYTSKALDPSAAPLETFDRDDPPVKRARLEDPVF